MKIKATILPATGKREYAILRWDDYQALSSAAGDDAIDGAILDSLPAYDRKDLLPGELVRRIIGGESPMAVWCEHRGIKPSGLARNIGVSPGYISDIIAGKKPGSVDVLRKIATALGVAVDDILSEVSSSPTR